MDHQKRHETLHSQLDELVADFIMQNKGKLPSNTSCMELMEWSSKQAKCPDHSD